MEPNEIIASLIEAAIPVVCGGFLAAIGVRNLRALGSGNPRSSRRMAIVQVVLGSALVVGGVVITGLTLLMRLSLD